MGVTNTEKAELVEAESEYEKLVKEVRLLKIKLLELTTERDDLKYHICPEIQSQYDSKIGILEHQVYAKYMYMNQLKREIEYAQAYVNRDEKPDFEDGKKKVEEEFEQYEEDLRRQAEEIRSRREKHDKEVEKEKAWKEENDKKKASSIGQTDDCQNMDDEEESVRIESDETEEEGSKQESDEEKEEYSSFSDELKKRYRSIVKRLHPDTNPNQTEREKRMFREAVEAYQNGDLDKLREISAVLEGENDDEGVKNTPEGVEQLKVLKESLRKAVDDIGREIDTIITTFPYTAKEFLDDKEAVEERQKELAEEIRTLNEQCEQLENRLDEMKKGA